MDHPREDRRGLKGAWSKGENDRQSAWYCHRSLPPFLDPSSSKGGFVSSYWVAPLFSFTHLEWDVLCTTSKGARQSDLLSVCVYMEQKLKPSPLHCL